MRRPWADEEVALIRHAFGSPTAHVDIKRLARRLGRTHASVAVKASRLGLGSSERLSKPQMSLRFGPQPHEALSRRAKANIARHGHPRGMLGKHHTEETKARIAANAASRWADPGNVLNSERLRQARSNEMVRRNAEGKMNKAFRYSRSKAGAREDLGGLYVRSRWEANYARFLNWGIDRGLFVSWEYEAKSFVFEKIKRGTRSYTPDFKVVMPSGTTEWHEVKGWMDDKSRVRLERMALFYPEEKLVLIDSKWFASARRNGLANIIAGWERDQ